MAQIPKEEQVAQNGSPDQPTVRGGAFAQASEAETPFGFGRVCSGLIFDSILLFLVQLSLGEKFFTVKPCSAPYVFFLITFPTVCQKVTYPNYHYTWVILKT